MNDVVQGPLSQWRLRFAVNLGPSSKVWQAAHVRGRGLVLLLWWLLMACGSPREARHGGRQVDPERSPILPAWNPRDEAISGLPGGETCLRWLSTLGIAYRQLPDLRGVETPVEVTGPIGAIAFVTGGSPSVTGDCRLILALDWASRTLARVGVSAVRHSGAYVYRTTRRGRPSLHARGLAIDVHAIQVHGAWYEVERDYARGMGAVCDSLQPFVNHVYCRLSQLNLFRELITPDHNADHYDHIHLGVASDG